MAIQNSAPSLSPRVSCAYPPNELAIKQKDAEDKEKALQILCGFITVVAIACIVFGGVHYGCYYKPGC